MKNYTMQNTIHDVYREEAIVPYLHLLFPEALMSFVPDELMNAPLEEVEKKVMFPWGLPFTGEKLLNAVNISRQIAYTDMYELIPLWTEEKGDYIPDVTRNDRSSVFLLRKKSSCDKVRPAVVICPGGGYETIAYDTEGIDYMMKLEEMGFAAFVLNYRFAPNRYPLEQYDLMLAIKYVRANAKRFGIDPDFVMAMGSSAGGHLCASTALLSHELEEGLADEIDRQKLPDAEVYRAKSGRPDSLCLCYPVISFLSETHEPSFQALTGGNEALREKLSVEQHVGADYPRTFVWTCEDDSLVPSSNAARMGAALEKAGVDSRCILYPQGEHGCSLAVGTSAEDWIDRMGEFILGKEK